MIIGSCNSTKPTPPIQTPTSMDIEIFEIKKEVNLPLRRDPNKIAGTKTGDLLICFDGKNVYAKHWDPERSENYALLLNDIYFFRANKEFFSPVG